MCSQAFLTLQYFSAMITCERLVLFMSLWMLFKITCGVEASHALAALFIFFPSVHHASSCASSIYPIAKLHIHSAHIEKVWFRHVFSCGYSGTVPNLSKIHTCCTCKILSAYWSGSLSTLGSILNLSHCLVQKQILCLNLFQKHW